MSINDITDKELYGKTLGIIVNIPIHKIEEILKINTVYIYSLIYMQINPLIINIITPFMSLLTV